MGVKGGELSSFNSAEATDEYRRSTLGVSLHLDGLADLDYP